MWPVIPHDHDGHNFEGKLKRSSYLTFSMWQLFKMNTLDWER